LAKRSTFKICERCNKRIADALLERLCHVCFRQMNFERLPDEAKEQEYLSVVPERFIKAEMSHLKEKLASILTKSENVLLWGPPGVGKSYALSATAKLLISSGFVCRRVNYELLCLWLRDTFKPSSKKSEWDIIEPLVNCDALFLEDVGTTKSIDSKESDFSLRTLLVIIDVRLERCRPTYISSNKSVENLTTSFDARIGDRLSLYEIIKMEGKSKRK
jgi:DNA replication protein DnaC